MEPIKTFLMSAFRQITQECIEEMLMLKASALYNTYGQIIIKSSTSSRLNYSVHPRPHTSTSTITFFKTLSTIVMCLGKVYKQKSYNVRSPASYSLKINASLYIFRSTDIV